MKIDKDIAKVKLATSETVYSSEHDQSHDSRSSLYKVVQLHKPRLVG